ncbi:MAG: hypothetical protein ACK4TJ_00120 [Tabrizicola sp.]
MTDYQETLRRHRRLAILRHLEASPEYTSNVSILQDVLAAVGLRSTCDQVTTEIVWLQEQGFVLADGDAFLVVTATARGAEIARGVANHPGVQRPGPR